jgi:hypothetical protein
VDEVLRDDSIENYMEYGTADARAIGVPSIGGGGDIEGVGLVDMG